MRQAVQRAWRWLGILVVIGSCHSALGDDPDSILKSLRVPEGFTVEKVAAAPLVGHPVMAGFDDRGRLFVADNAGLNLPADKLLEQLPNMIRMLEDTDGDGSFPVREISDPMLHSQRLVRGLHRALRRCNRITGKLQRDPIPRFLPC